MRHASGHLQPGTTVEHCAASTSERNAMKRRNSKPTSWRAFVASLTQEQRDKMLMALLSQQIEGYGEDGDVFFREADEDDPADICWSSCGDSLLDD